MEFASTTHLDKDEESRGDSETDESIYLAHRAAAAGNITLLMDAVNQDPSVLECQDEKGMTPLSHAVTNQRLELLKLLVKMGADINTQDSLGRTPLCLAAYECWYEGVVFLLRNGAKQLIPDTHGRLPIHAATCDKDSKTLSALLQNLVVSDINEADNDGMTALHWAAFHNRPEHVQLIMLRGGDIYQIDIDEKTPMHWASQNGSVICCSIMAKCHSGGAPLINALEGTGKNCVHLASAAGNALILEVFASIPEVDFEALDPDERVPLHWAAVKGNTDCVVYLVQLGVELSPEDVCGRTPLGYAHQAGMTEIVRYLKDSGAEFGKMELLAFEKRNSSLSGKIKEQKTKENGKETKKSRFKILTGWLDKRKHKSKDSENGEKNQEDECEDLFHDGTDVHQEIPQEINDQTQSLTVPTHRPLQRSLSDKSNSNVHPEGNSPVAIHFDSSPRSEGSLSLYSSDGKIMHSIGSCLSANNLDSISPRSSSSHHSIDGVLSVNNMEEISPRSTISNQSLVSNHSGSVNSTDHNTTLLVPNLTSQEKFELTNSAGTGRVSSWYRDDTGREASNSSFPRYNPLPDPFLLSNVKSNVPVKSVVPDWSSEGPDYEVLERQAREILDAQKKADEDDMTIKIQLPEGDFWNRFPYNNTGNPKLEPIRRRSTSSTFSKIPESVKSSQTVESLTAHCIVDSSLGKHEKEKNTKKRRKPRKKDPGQSPIKIHGDHSVPGIKPSSS